MIEFDSDNLVIHNKLDKKEAVIFCKFLVTEKKRHEDDVKMIQNTIDYLKNKFEFDAEILESIYEFLEN